MAVLQALDEMVMCTPTTQLFDQRARNLRPNLPLDTISSTLLKRRQLQDHYGCYHYSSKFVRYSQSIVGNCARMQLSWLLA